MESAQENKEQLNNAERPHNRAAEVDELPSSSVCYSFEELYAMNNLSKADTEDSEKKLSFEEMRKRHLNPVEDKGVESCSQDCRIKHGAQDSCDQCANTALGESSSEQPETVDLSKYPRWHSPTTSDEYDGEEEEIRPDWQQYYEDTDLYEELGYVPDEAEYMEDDDQIDLTLSHTSLTESDAGATTAPPNVDK